MPLQVETNFCHPLTTLLTLAMFTCGCLITKMSVDPQGSGIHSGFTGRWGLPLRWSHAQIVQPQTVGEQLVILALVVLMETANA